MLGILNRLNETEQREDDLAQATEIDLRIFLQGYFKQRSEALTRDDLEVFQVLLSETPVNKDLRELYYRQVIEPTFAIATPFSKP